MSKFKPMQIAFDEVSYKLEEENIEKRMLTVSKALQWMTAAAPNVKFNMGHNDWYNLHQGFVNFFKEKYWEVNQKLIKLPISVEKALDLMDINTEDLEALYSRYKSFPVKVVPSFSDEGIWYPIERTDYIKWTESAEENKRLKIARKFIEVMDEVAEVTTVNPTAIVRGTNQLVSLDVIRGELIPNIPRQSNRGVV